MDMKGFLWIVVASLAALAGSAPARAVPPPRAHLAVQRDDRPPTWSIGTWTGRNDRTRDEIELRIDDQGRITMIVRQGRDARTTTGAFRSGRIEMGRDRYSLRQSGKDLRLILEGDRKEETLFRRTDGPGGRQDLSILEPKNNERLRTGTVWIRGETDMPEVSIEVRRDGKTFQRGTAAVRRNRYEWSLRCQPGRYEATVQARLRRGTIERKVTFNVGGMGRTVIESPKAGERVQSGNVTIRGTSEAPDVEVEIYRGRERISVQRVSVRNDRFQATVNLGWGTYTLTVRALEDGKVIGLDKRGFDVAGGPGPISRDLRLDRPSNRDQIRGPWVDFVGTAGGTKVRIQVFRGRDRVVNQLVDVRDGSFRTRVRLDNGHYDATIGSEDRGRVLVERKISFDVR